MSSISPIRIIRWYLEIKPSTGDGVNEKKNVSFFHMEYEKRNVFVESNSIGEEC